MAAGLSRSPVSLAAALACSFSRRHGRNVPFGYNRKEAKDHGEGGNLVGAPLRGHVLIVDDVISAGTSVRESIGWIEQAGARTAGVAIALDRQEKGEGDRSAAQEVSDELGIGVISIAGLDDLVEFLEKKPNENIYIEAIRMYRSRYGC